MADLNLDDFYADAARALVTLLEVFPRPHTLFVEDLCGPAEPDEFGLPPKRQQSCFAALLWLADEGYLRHQGPIRQEAVDQAVLTERALLVLNAPPRHSPLADVSNTSPQLYSEQLTLATSLRRALKARDSFALREAVLNVLDHRRRPSGAERRSP